MPPNQRHTGRTILWLVVAVVIVLGVISAAKNNGTAPAPAPTPQTTTITVCFTVEC
jgi:hypothetical protein